ncbi:MAG: hypothetical protein M3387_00975, partial [Actinomycetota bacterium]|nr:hypothetical protein [Actinomycetota bacterium]
MLTMLARLFDWMWEPSETGRAHRHRGGDLNHGHLTKRLRGGHRWPPAMAGDRGRTEARRRLTGRSNRNDELVQRPPLSAGTGLVTAVARRLLWWTLGVAAALFVLWLSPGLQAPAAAIVPAPSSKANNRSVALVGYTSGLLSVPAAPGDCTLTKKECDAWADYAGVGKANTAPAKAPVRSSAPSSRARATATAGPSTAPTKWVGQDGKTYTRESANKELTEISENLRRQREGKPSSNNGGAQNPTRTAAVKPAQAPTRAGLSDLYADKGDRGCYGTIGSDHVCYSFDGKGQIHTTSCPPDSRNPACAPIASAPKGSGQVVERGRGKVIAGAGGVVMRDEGGRLQTACPNCSGTASNGEGEQAHAAPDPPNRRRAGGDATAWLSPNNRVGATCTAPCGLSGRNRRGQNVNVRPTPHPGKADAQNAATVDVGAKHVKTTCRQDCPGSGTDSDATVRFGRSRNLAHSKAESDAPRPGTTVDVGQNGVTVDCPGCERFTASQGSGKAAKTAMITSGDSARAGKDGITLTCSKTYSDCTGSGTGPRGDAKLAGAGGEEIRVTNHETVARCVGGAAGGEASRSCSPSSRQGDMAVELTGGGEAKANEAGVDGECRDGGCGTGTVRNGARTGNSTGTGGVRLWADVNRSGIAGSCPGCDLALVDPAGRGRAASFRGGGIAKLDDARAQTWCNPRSPTCVQNSSDGKRQAAITCLGGEVRTDGACGGKAGGGTVVDNERALAVCDGQPVKGTIDCTHRVSDNAGVEASGRCVAEMLCNGQSMM